jgi:hypothetical protein
VELSPDPLPDYLARNPAMTGLRVARAAWPDGGSGTEPLQQLGHGELHHR